MSDLRRSVRPSPNRFPDPPRAWRAAHGDWLPTVCDDEPDDGDDVSPVDRSDGPARRDAWLEPDGHSERSRRRDPAALRGRGAKSTSLVGFGPGFGFGPAFDRCALAMPTMTGSSEAAVGDATASPATSGSRHAPGRVLIQAFTAARSWRVLIMGLLGGLVGLAVGASVYQFGPTVGVATDVPLALRAPSGDGAARASGRETWPPTAVETTSMSAPPSTLVAAVAPVIVPAPRVARSPSSMTRAGAASAYASASARASACLDRGCAGSTPSANAAACSGSVP